MASTLTAYNRLRPPSTRAARSLLAVGCRTGVVGRVVGQSVRLWADPIEADRHMSFLDELRRRLGRPDLEFAIGIGKMDRHYKPTAQLFGADARPVGFAKLGWTPATALLVEREAAALRSSPATCDRWPGVEVPDLLASGSWGGSPFLVTAPLPADVRSVASGQQPLAASRSIAGPLYEESLRTSAYWRTVMTRLAHLHDQDALGPVQQLDRCVSELDRLAGESRWRFGRWHGDWVPWNIARRGSRIHVWDWEHSTDAAPWGFDHLHWSVTVPHLLDGVEYPAAVVNSSVPLADGAGASLEELRLAYLIEMMLRSSALAEPGTATTTYLYPDLDVALAATLAALQ